nr:hypothetical protein [Acidobacteriota bacterium]
QPSNRNPLHEAITIVDIEDEEAMTTVLEISADARNRNIQVPPGILISRGITIDGSISHRNSERDLLTQALERTGRGCRDGDCREAQDEQRE